MPIKFTTNPTDNSIPFFFAGILVGLSTIVAYNVLLPKVKIFKKEELHVYINEKETASKKNLEKLLNKNNSDLKNNNLIEDNEVNNENNEKIEENEVDIENENIEESENKQNKEEKKEEDDILNQNSNLEVEVSEEETIENKELLNEDEDENETYDAFEKESEDSEEEEEAENGYTEESQSLLTLLYSIAEDQARKEGYIHRSIICNNCGEQIQGFRYKCTNCVDYDLCETCEALGVHYITHVFLKIRISIPPLANPRQSLLPVFYPGNDFISKKLDEKQLHKLHQKTHFDIVELEAFYDQYNSLSTYEGEGGGITHDTFELCLGPLSLEKNLIIERLFRFFDQSHDGIINFEELVCGLSILCKGSLDERIKHTFIGYDLDEDNKLSRSELKKMLTAYFRLSMNLVRDVVKIMEEGIMENFDDEASKPVSSVFAAPIPSSNNNFQNDGKGKDKGIKEEEVSGFGMNTIEEFEEDFPYSDTEVGHDENGEKSNTIELNNEMNKDHIHDDDHEKELENQTDASPSAENKNSTSENEPTSNMEKNHIKNKTSHVSMSLSNTNDMNDNKDGKHKEKEKEAIKEDEEVEGVEKKHRELHLSKSNKNLVTNITIPTTITNNSTVLKNKRSSLNLSALPTTSTPASTTSATTNALQTQTNLIQKINQQQQHYENLRHGGTSAPPTATHDTNSPFGYGTLPIMEAVSQDTIEEVVNKTFALAHAENKDYLTFEEFQRVAEADITILAWFEALGSVF